MIMKINLVVRSLGLLLTAIRAVQAHDFSADEVKTRTIERRAIEAVIWGMPVVNYELMYQSMVKTGGKYNQVVYWSRLPDWNDPDAHAKHGQGVPSPLHQYE